MDTLRDAMSEKREAPSPVVDPPQPKRTKSASNIDTFRSSRPPSVSDIVAAESDRERPTSVLSIKDSADNEITLDRADTVDAAPLTPLSTSFEGTLQYITTCLECGNESRREEAFVDLTLSVTAQGGSLHHLFSESVGKPEHLTGSNKYWCDNCNHACEAIRKARISKLPPVLCIHLNRATYAASSKVR